MGIWGNYYRFVVLFVGFICLTSIGSNYIIINFTFICMKNDMSAQKVVDGNIVSLYDYTNDEKKWIMWSLAAGTIIGTLPVNIVTVKYGAKYPFFIAGVVSFLSTALIPLAAEYSFEFLAALRFIQGVAYSADFAAIGVINVRWAPLKETAFFIATMTSFTAISSTLTNSITGMICESSLGWKYSYYFHAIFGLVCFLLWILIYSDDPKDSKRVSPEELQLIQENKTAAHLNKRVDIPYLAIFTSPVVLIVWLNAFFEMSAIILFTTYMPIYFNSVLQFSITETGFYVGFILGINIPLRLIAALLSDKITFISEKLKIRIYNTISVGVSGILLATVGFIDREQRMLCFFTILITMQLIAVNCGGFYKCAALYARQFAHVVIAAIQFTKCIALFTSPALVAFFVSDESNRFQWIPVFISMGAACFLANLISLFFFTDEPAKWTNNNSAINVVTCETVEKKL